LTPTAINMQVYNSWVCSQSHLLSIFS